MTEDAMKADETVPFYLKNSSIYIVVIFNDKHEIYYSNPYFASIFNPPATDTVLCFTDYLEVDERSAFRMAVDQLTKNPQNQQPALFLSRHENYDCKWEISLLPKVGNTPSFVAIGQADKDKNLPYSLSQDQELLTDFINNSPASSWITDEDGCMIFMNRVYKDLTGLTDEHIGKTLWEIFPRELADIYHDNNIKVLRANKIVGIEENSMDKFGTIHNYINYKFPVMHDGYKKLIGGWTIDSTERRETDNKLLEYQIRLKQISFLQSHQVRRPLSNILGILELMNYYKEHELYGDAMDLLKYLNQSAGELDELIQRIVRNASVK